jgi:hypothetical protein
MTRVPRSLLAAVVFAGAAVLAWIGLAGPRGAVRLDEADPVGRPPNIRPDYGGLVIPPNVAPMNFAVEEPGEAYAAVLRSARGEPVAVRGCGRSIRVPLAAWRRLLEANRDGELAVDIGVRAPEGRWRRFAPLSSRIAPEPIDEYLVYRYIKPIHNKYANVGIYQRDLRGFDARPVLRNAAFDGGCVNCHTFRAGDPARMILHIRGPHGPAMLLARDGAVVKVDTRTALHPAPAAYSSWHPRGQVLAFSVNTISQFFHTVGENRDVFDADSDLAVYRVDANTVTTAPGLADPDRLETWPAWSADGRHLYFSSAPKLPQERSREVRYDLVRVAYDPLTGAWGAPETILSARDAGRSLLEPRPSPDGRWLLFCGCDYGNFPIYQTSADLYLMDLATRRWRRLECNSDACDSYHSWSSNSRWIVFSSKRDNGVFARPYFNYIDPQGRASKPFVLPQEDPAFYDSCIQTFNAPELATGPVTVSRRAWADAICSPGPGQELKATLDPAVRPRGATAPAPPEDQQPA